MLFYSGFTSFFWGRENKNHATMCSNFSVEKPPLLLLPNSVCTCYKVIYCCVINIISFIDNEICLYSQSYFFFWFVFSHPGFVRPLGSLILTIIYTTQSNVI